MKYLKTLSTVAMTGMAAILATGITGCGQKPQEEQTQAKGAFVIIEETAPGKYKIKDEFPADETRIVLKKLDGTEKILTKEEMDALVKKEAAKIDNGTSELTQPNAQIQEGMGLGEAILASAAGAIIGSWIGNKLFGNQNYQNNRKAGYKSPSTYQRSKNGFSKTRKTTTKRSGFFGNSKKSMSRSGGFFGG
ncbi:FIG01388762: membrane lipoprotein [hydrothermal vent metagenome]|uniref:FIG01388762: membrane lipoprotein n=1 Tax=hydrothermal vent metagenome TaxID=652676 RepID=A0A1W1EAT9_9ZZZZ